MHALILDGPGPPVVLVHGVIASSAYFVPTAELLRKSHSVYVPDLPGFGKSDDPPQTLDVHGLADALECWMEAIGLDRAAMLANSYGCQIGVDLAVRYPERVESMILVAPTVDPRARTWWQQGARLALDYLRERPSLTPVEVIALAQAGIGRSLMNVRYMLRDRIEDRLPLVRVPVLVVRGERDPIVPQRWAEEVTRLLPHGRLVVLPGAPHAANYSSPRLLTEVVERFLRGDDPAGATRPPAARPERRAGRS